MPRARIKEVALGKVAGKGPKERQATWSVGGRRGSVPERGWEKVHGKPKAVSHQGCIRLASQWGQGLCCGRGRARNHVIMRMDNKRGFGR